MTSGNRKGAAPSNIDYLNAAVILELAPFDREALIVSLREDQAGRTAFPQVPGSHLACRRRPLPRRFRGAQRDLSWCPRRGIRGDLPSRHALVGPFHSRLDVVSHDGCLVTRRASLWALSSCKAVPKGHGPSVCIWSDAVLNSSTRARYAAKSQRWLAF